MVVPPPPRLSQVSMFLNFNFLGEIFALCYTSVLAKISLASFEVYFREQKTKQKNQQQQNP